jgi:hypothetical protein
MIIGLRPSSLEKSRYYSDISCDSIMFYRESLYNRHSLLASNADSNMTVSSDSEQWQKPVLVRQKIMASI